MHPGPYHCLASPTPKVVERTIKGLNKHAEQFDMMGFVNLVLITKLIFM